jgi:hypothetical protein
MLMYLLVWLSTSYLGLGLVGGFGDLLGRLEFRGEGLSGLFGLVLVKRGCLSGGRLG